jgi:hypothetical protein
MVHFYGVTVAVVVVDWGELFSLLLNQFLETSLRKNLKRNDNCRYNKKKTDRNFPFEPN